MPYLDKIMKKFILRDLKQNIGRQHISITYDFIDTRAITFEYMKSIAAIRPLFTSPSEQAKKVITLF